MIRVRVSGTNGYFLWPAVFFLQHSLPQAYKPLFCLQRSQPQAYKPLFTTIIISKVKKLKELTNNLKNC